MATGPKKFDKIDQNPIAAMIRVFQPAFASLSIGNGHYIVTSGLSRNEVDPRRLRQATAGIRNGTHWHTIGVTRILYAKLFQGFSLSKHSSEVSLRLRQS
jgi:hypothetical protein